jgi:hypothetical protein
LNSYLNYKVLVDSTKWLISLFIYSNNKQSVAVQYYIMIINSSNGMLLMWPFKWSGYIKVKLVIEG